MKGPRWGGRCLPGARIEKNAVFMPGIFLERLHRLRAALAVSRRLDAVGVEEERLPPVILREVLLLLREVLGSSACGRCRGARRRAPTAPSSSPPRPPAPTGNPSRRRRPGRRPSSSRPKYRSMPPDELSPETHEGAADGATLFVHGLSFLHRPLSLRIAGGGYCPPCPGSTETVKAGTTPIRAAARSHPSAIVQNGLCGHLPEVTIGIGKVARVAAPEGVMRRLHDLGAGGTRFGQDGIDLAPAPRIVGERNPGERRA